MADQNINNMTVVWNSGGTTFNAIKMNVTDTASAIASALLLLQVGGSDKFKVGKDGSITAAGALAVTGNSTITGNLTVSGTLTAGGIAGSMTGPGSSTDNAIARFNGTTGTTVQNSGVTIDDSNNLTLPGNLVTSGNVFMTSAISSLSVSGGNAAQTGGYILLFGQSHATLANRIYLRGNTITFNDASAGNTASVVIGGTLTVTG